MPPPLLLLWLLLALLLPPPPLAAQSADGLGQEQEKPQEQEQEPGPGPGQEQEQDLLVAQFDAAVEECRQEHPLAQEELDGLKMMMIPSSQVGKCFLGCLLERMNVTESGQFKLEAAEEHARTKFADRPREMWQHLTLARTCGMEVAELRDFCETAPRLLACVQEHAPWLGIMLPGSD